MSYINFLQAGQGEAILIHLDPPVYNILIDGGNNQNEFRDKILPELKEIRKRGECIDLLMITHQDDDHILGILWFTDLMRRGEEGFSEDFVKRYIFNTPHLIEEGYRVPEGTELSDNHGLQIEKYLYQTDPDKWRNHGLMTTGGKIKCADAELCFITPSAGALQKYYGERRQGWISSGRELKNSPLCDFFEKIAFSEKKDRQSDAINGASLSLDMVYHGKHYLFLGDITPEEFETPFRQYIEREWVETFALVKLAHHGSRRNTTMQIAALLRCRHYVICTDGNNNGLPDKMTIAKLLKAKTSPDTISFFFNYDKPFEDLKITAAEKQKYGFDLIGPNKGNGYTYVIE